MLPVAQVQAAGGTAVLRAARKRRSLQGKLSQPRQQRKKVNLTYPYCHL